MGKASMCIQMLQILRSGRVYKCTELAELLETNPRNVIEYKKELEEAGYYIVSIPGKYGGYKLEQGSLIPSLNLSNEEKKVLQIGTDYLLSRGDFLDAKVFQMAISRIFSSIERLPISQETFIIPGITLAMSSEELKERYQTIEQCIQQKLKITIDFLSNDNVVRTRKIHPYRLFMHNNAWFVIGYCESFENFAYFKLNRIQKFSVTNEKFQIKLSYNERDYLDENGLKHGGDWSNRADKGSNEWIHIKLCFTGKPAMYVQEYKYGLHQIVTPIDQNHTMLECDMHYHYNTVKFVLGFGTDCEIIEPKWLQDEVQEIIRCMMK